MTPHLFASLLLALTLHAGTSHGASPKIDEAALADMRTGRTTFEEIVRRFGRPNFASTSWDGTRTAAYAYGEGRSTAALTLPALGAVLGGSGSDTVVLYFDGKGVLTDYKVSRAAAKPADAPAVPTVRYVEPSFGGTKPAPAAKPAAAAMPAAPTTRSLEPSTGGTPPLAATPAAAAVKPIEATPAAPATASKPAAAQAVKPEARSDGLPWWLPSSSTREERY
jgi:hypothetical protein